MHAVSYRSIFIWLLLKVSRSLIHRRVIVLKNAIHFGTVTKLQLEHIQIQSQNIPFQSPDDGKKTQFLSNNTQRRISLNWTFISNQRLEFVTLWICAPHGLISSVILISLHNFYSDSKKFNKLLTQLNIFKSSWNLTRWWSGHGWPLWLGIWFQPHFSSWSSLFYVYSLDYLLVPGKKNRR